MPDRDANIPQDLPKGAKEAEKRPESGVTEDTKKDWKDETSRVETIKQEGVDKGKK